MHFKNNSYIHLLIPVGETVIFGLIVASFLVMINVVKLDIARAFPFVATYLVVLSKMLTQMNALNTSRSEVASNLAAIDTYGRMLDPKGKRTIMTGTHPVGVFSKGIKFSDVWFAYNGMNTC
jgi:hypothetical protein